MRSKNRKRRPNQPSMPIIDETREIRLARANTYLDATCDEFLAHLELAQQGFENVPKGGALAGPKVKRPITDLPLKKILEMAKEATCRAARKKTST